MNENMKANWYGIKLLGWFFKIEANTRNFEWYKRRYYSRKQEPKWLKWIEEHEQDNT